jgi:hypothetical protein
MFEGFKQLLSRLNYSHWGNLKSLSDISANQREELFFMLETKNKLVSDYRSAHMGIVAGVIAFLGFIGKDEVLKNPETYQYFWWFIFGSIIFLVSGYYLDNIFISRQFKYTSHNFSWTRNAIGKIKNTEFDAKERDMLINSQKKENKWLLGTYHIFIGFAGIVIWWILFVWIFKFIS